MGAQASKEDFDRGARMQQEEIDAQTAKFYAIERANIQKAKAKKKAERLASEAAQKRAERLASEGAQEKASTPPQKPAKPKSTTKSGDSAIVVRPKKKSLAKTERAKAVQKIEAGERKDGSTAKSDTPSSNHLKRKSSTPDAGARKKPTKPTVLELDSDDDDEVMEVDLSMWKPRKERVRK